MFKFRFRRRCSVKNFIFGLFILIWIWMLLKNYGRSLRINVYRANDINIVPTPPQTGWQYISRHSSNYANRIVYSAYGDKSYEYVKILGVAKESDRSPVFCHFSALINTTLKVVSVSSVTLNQMSESWHLPFRGYFYECSLPDDAKPTYVSISSNESTEQKFENKLWIQYESDAKLEDKVDFAVCVKPVHGNNHNPARILEWLEFHRLMGVTKFTFYDLTMDIKMQCMLQEFGKVRQVTVEVLPWKNLPFIGTTSHGYIRGGNMALSVAQNDCVFRSRGRAKYMVFVDLDEMIVPKIAENYEEMMRQINQPMFNFDNGVTKIVTGGFIFVHAFFHTETLGNITNAPLEGLMVTLTNRMRMEIYHKHGQRSKYICMPDFVEDAGNHFLATMVEGYTSVYVHSTVALLHHYRRDWKQLLSQKETLKNNEVDNSTVKFGEQLISKVSELFEHTKLICNITYEV